jgi:DNA-binding response OmpR family regulator
VITQFEADSLSGRHVCAQLDKDVLIVDDDAAIRKLMLVALERLGLRCETAHDGIDALDQMKRTRYAVILLDLMMPRLDGKGVVARMRDSGTAAGERPVVIILTAFPEADYPPLDGTVVHAVIRKPFDLIELAGLLHACVTVRRTVQPEPPPPPRAYLPAK